MERDRDKEKVMDEVMKVVLCDGGGKELVMKKIGVGLWDEGSRNWGWG